ncbi:MAG: alkaline phosphatase family protein [Lachnospiraceae bacterium]|nr:alkaline phosphatase family protein [Lachnospiraceae bacterium]
MSVRENRLTEGRPFSALPDYNNCLVNLSNSILKRFGGQTTAETLSLADKYLDGEYRNVVLLVLDALGMSIIEKHLDKNAFFRSHLAGSFDSVYPPTTVAATTSLLSGLYPDEHGWLGWDVYYPQIDKNVTVFRNTEQIKEKENAVPTVSFQDGGKRWTKDSLNEALPAEQYNVGFRYTPYKNIIEIIKEAGGNAYAAMPFLPPYPNSMEAILERIGALCGEPDRKFIYAYWNEPDSTMHKTGTGSPETHKVITELESMIEKAVSGLPDTLFLITADHGHMDSINYCLLDYPEIMDCLVRYPSFEPRTLNLFVKNEYRELFPRIFNKYFGDSFILMTREEVISKRVFGTGNDRDGLENMLGDYVALAVSDKSIFNTHFEAQEMPGGHAGLTVEEIRIPLIVIGGERK